MESKYVTISYENCKDLKKAINIKTLVVGVVLLLIGLYISLFLSTADPKSNLNMLRLFGGWAVTGVGLVLLLFCLRHWVYAPTSSSVKRYTRDFTIEQLPKLREMLGEDGDFKVSDVSVVHLDFYASADRQFVAFQVMQYANLGERPLGEVAYRYNESAEAFIKAYEAM